LTFTPTTPGLVEDIVLLEMASASSDRRAIQVFGDAPPRGVSLRSFAFN
jgi:hypothetical protein